MQSLNSIVKKGEYFTSHNQNVAAAVHGGMFLAPGSSAQSLSL